MSEHHGGQFPPQQQWPQQPYPPQQQWPQQQQQQGWPQRPPKKGLSTKVKVLLLVAAVVVVGGLAGLIIVAKAAAGPEKQAGKLEVGDCVQLTGAGKEADAVKTPCNAPNTPYMVSVVGVDKGDWNCSEGFYRVAIPTPMRGEGVALCLGVNGQIGACFDDIESKTPPKLVECGKARLKVLTTAPANPMGTGCPDNTEKTLTYMGYMDPRFKSVTICFGKP
ncbi:LppU/SCO3897 family protein [Amycolatopsis orientalis]|uniref:LppU/SCO3897 family protein n=1 Tax=Amycolatopsis orientalis TaxID=31958 RepID=UPI00055EEC06|nr:hypothetical protein [Amycolatopsis orientalis]